MRLGRKTMRQPNDRCSRDCAGEPLLVAPFISFDAVDATQGNRMLVAWGHRMGPVNRPMGATWWHALHHNGEPVAVVCAAALICERVAGFDRSEAVELARLCAVRPDLCRPTLRLWREFVLPALQAKHGYQWAVSYQDEALHSGNVYRFDGWVDLEQSRSGTDARSNRKGRSKRIWAWPRDAAQIHAERRPDKTAVRAHLTQEQPR